MDDVEQLLKLHMVTMVPLLAYELRDFDASRAELDELSQLIACRSDGIMFRSKDTAFLVGKLARALAIMSFVPDGVETFGVRFVSERGLGCVYAGSSEQYKEFRREVVP
jgi:hypothetical protein